MAQNEIKLLLTIDGKQAIAAINNTDEIVKKLYQSFKYGKQEINGFTTAISQGFNNAREIIQGFRETYSALQSILSTPVQAAIDLEQSIVSFEVLLGSGEKAAQMINDLREFAAKTPLQLSGLQENSKLLLSFGVEAQNVLPYLKMLGDISGGNAQKMNQLTLAFAQMQSAGRLMGQDLMQMINAGFNPLQIIAEKTGKSIGELKKEMESGAISSDMIIQAFKDATSEGGKFYGMLEKQSETLGGKLSTLQDNFQQLQQQIGGTIAIGLSPLIEEFSKALNTVNSFSPALAGLIGTFGTLTAAAFTLKTTGLLPLVGNLQGVQSIIERVRVQLALAPAGVGLFQKSLASLSATLKGLAASIGPAGWLILGVTALTAAINLLSTSTDGLTDSERQVIASADAEKIKFDQLTKTILDQNKSLSERNKAKEEAQKIYPGFLENLSIEKTRNEDLTAAVSKGRVEFGKFIEMKILNQRLDLAIQDLAKKKNEDITPGFWDSVLGAAQSLINGTPAMINAQVNAAVNHADSVADAEKKINDILAEINKQPAVNNDKNKQLSDDELKKQFEKNKAELSEAQRHQQAMLKITSDNDYLMLMMKIKHFNQMIELYKKFNQDTTSLINQRTETETELAKKNTKLVLPPEYSINLKKKYDLNERNAQEISDINEKHAREDLRISELTTEEKLNLLDEQKTGVANAMGEIAGVFAKHTLAYQAFAKAQALIDTYTSAEAAYKALVGIPFVGPALAVAAAAAAIAAGLARVEQIGKVNIPQGFAEGGRLPQGKSGYVEGWHNEIIAPEKTFVEVFRNELRPQIYGNTTNYDLSGIKESLNRLNNALEQGIVARAYLDDREAKKITAKGTYLNNKSKL